MLLYVVVSVACGLLDFLLESKMRVTEGESKILRKGYLHCLQLAWQFFFIFLVSQLRKNISCFLHHLWLLRFAHRARFSISSKTGNMSERWKIQTDQLLWPEFKKKKHQHKYALTLFIALQNLWWKFSSYRLAWLTTKKRINFSWNVHV